MQNTRVIAVCFDSQVIYINALCGQNVEVLSIWYIKVTHKTYQSRHIYIYIYIYIYTYVLKSRLKLFKCCFADRASQYIYLSN